MHTFHGSFSRTLACVKATDKRMKVYISRHMSHQAWEETLIAAADSNFTTTSSFMDFNCAFRMVKLFLIAHHCAKWFLSPIWIVKLDGWWFLLHFKSIHFAIKSKETFHLETFFLFLLRESCPNFFNILVKVFFF